MFKNGTIMKDNIKINAGNEKFPFLLVFPNRRRGWADEGMRPETQDVPPPGDGNPAAGGLKINLQSSFRDFASRPTEY